MKIDLTETIKTLKGEEMKQVDAAGQVVSETSPLGDMLFKALDFVSKEITSDEKLFRGRMMKKIMEAGGGELELTSQDASRLQKIVEPYFGVQSYTYVHDILDG